MTTDARLLSMPVDDNVRPFEVARDLNPVADLIELCFADTLGVDGQRYLTQMRAAARNPRFLRWAVSVSEFVSFPLTGYVWEEDGAVVGNASLIPFQTSQKRIYLIANVAVHPDYRRRGIARTLTEHALEMARGRRRVQAVWLHVREENEAAFRLYSSMGFVEQARRTTWRKRRDFWPEGTVPRVLVQSRRPQHWPAQRAWLERLYPPSLDWNLTINFSSLRPGLWGVVTRLLNGVHIRQWSAVRDKKLLGILAWQPGRSQHDHLWLAAPPDGEELAVRALLGQVHPSLSRNTRLTLDFPAGHAVQAFENVGFTREQTLIWMETKL